MRTFWGPEHDTDGSGWWLTAVHVYKFIKLNISESCILLYVINI